MKVQWKFINANKFGKSHGSPYINIELNTGIVFRKYSHDGFLIYFTVLGFGFRLFIGEE